LCSENGLISDSPKLTYMAIFFKTTNPHLFWLTSSTAQGGGGSLKKGNL
jgi:hypothetical protein